MKAKRQGSEGPKKSTVGSMYGFAGQKAQKAGQRVYKQEQKTSQSVAAYMANRRGSEGKKKSSPRKTAKGK